MNHPDDVPTSLTRRAYALRGVTVSQNEYAAVVADAYGDIEREVLREAAEKLRDASPFGRGPCVLGRAADYRCGSEYCESCTVKSLINLIDPDKDN
jgi:hypothetical protein